MQASLSISMTWGVVLTEEGEIPKNVFLQFFQTALIFSTAALEVNEPHTLKFFGPPGIFDLYERSRNLSATGSKTVLYHFI